MDTIHLEYSGRSTRRVNLFNVFPVPSVQSTLIDSLMQLICFYTSISISSELIHCQHGPFSEALRVSSINISLLIRLSRIYINSS